MSERRERIPAEEVSEPKRWNLPFWTEPKHVVHSEEHDEEEVSVEEEEIEVEPLTAEQLETIRQEAFNEGLEQGLIEGRQKGEKLGYDEGHAEGFKQGEQEGKRLGFDAGFETGEKQAFQNGTLEQEKIAKRFIALLQDAHQQLTDSKQQLLNDIPDIILAMAKAVITEELSQGSEHIITLVQQALDALPLESGELKIEVNPQDLPFIEAAIEQGEFEGVAHSSDNIAAGGCRIHTRYSSVDFTLSERWAHIEKQYRHQLQLALNQDEDDETQPAYLNEDYSDSEVSEAAIIDPQDSSEVEAPTDDEEQSQASLKDEDADSEELHTHGGGIQDTDIQGTDIQDNLDTSTESDPSEAPTEIESDPIETELTQESVSDDAESSQDLNESENTDSDASHENQSVDSPTKPHDGDDHHEP
ncbi:MAG: hypothetical protein HWE18_16425 [Gammaproteobacteria bacterium]|nr:hypothetical protein [Gammaproteobacteria bacterium]